MPPDITAGLMALAGAPPGAAVSAALLPEPLGASLFAAFLAQSSPPSVTPAAPKAAATQILTAASKQTPLENQALPKTQSLPKTQPLASLKTMDTLPTLSFPALPKSKANARELPLPQALQHQKPAVDQRPAEGTPAPNALALAPLLAGPTAALPVLFAAWVPTTPVAAVTAPTTAAAAIVPATAVTAPTTAVAALTAAVLVPLAPAAPLGQAASEQSVPALISRPDTPAPTSLRAAAPGQVTSALPAPAQAVPAQTSLPLPRTWTLTAPLQALPPQMGQPMLVMAQVTGAEQTPDPKAAGMNAAKPVAVTTAPAAAANSLPRVPISVSAVPFQPAPPSQSVLSEAMPSLPPSAAQASQNILTPSPAMTVAAAPLAAALPALEAPVRPAKIAGKFLPAALKPSGENADTSTRTTPEQDQTGSVKAGVPKAGVPKAGVPAAAPEPLPEKHTEEQKLSLAADSGTNNALLSQAAAPADTAKADKPLSATERAEVVRQAAEGVGAMPLPAKPGAPEQMSIQLHPKDWGSLQVSVTVVPSQNAGAAKTVTAHIVAETPQVKAALQSQTGALHQALRTSGMHLEHLTVSVKAPENKAVEVKALEVKTATQSASAELPSRQSQSGQSQADLSGQPRSFGQPGANTGGSGMGSSQNNRQGQPPPAFLSVPETEDDLAPATPLRPVSGRIDTRA